LDQLAHLPVHEVAAVVAGHEFAGEAAAVTSTEDEVPVLTDDVFPASPDFDEEHPAHTTASSRTAIATRYQYFSFMVSVSRKETGTSIILHGCCRQYYPVQPGLLKGNSPGLTGKKWMYD
jgi:hypothetical protein